MLYLLTAQIAKLSHSGRATEDQENTNTHRSETSHEGILSLRAFVSLCETLPWTNSACFTQETK